MNDSTPPTERRSRNFLGVGLALLLASAAFFSGLQLGSGNAHASGLQASLLSLFQPATQPEQGVDMGEYWKVWHLMNQKFAETGSSTVSTQDKVRGAIAGMVKSFGDPYTVFMPPTDASQFGDEIAGNFGGVGMEVGVRDNLITVIAPLPDTPAKKAGIRPGDVIVRINGTSTENMNLDQAINLIRGEKGTSVELTLYREGQTQLLKKSVVRDTITVPTVETKKYGDVFYIALYSFNALSEAKMEDAMREYVKSGSDKLVIDLRGNPGGYLQSAVAIASYFLPAGDVVVKEQYGDNKGEDIYRSQGRTLKGFAPKDVVVLVNGGSASAAEILSGALQQHNAATLIGQQTFGKGSVQELVKLDDGSSLKVTIARWLTPDGTWISKSGLTPDVIIPFTAADAAAGKDPQLDAALKWLHGDHSIGTPKTAATTTTAFYENK